MSGLQPGLRPLPELLDPASKRTLLRVAFRLGGITFLMLCPWLTGARPLDMALHLLTTFGGAASLFCGMVAVAAHEPFGRGTLNHWDEAMVYIAFSRLTDALQTMHP